MKPFTRKILAAKVALTMAVSLLPGVISPAHAGIPVVDGANLKQNLMTAFESVTQTLKQVQQYQTQLQQYENQLRNTLQPTTQLWDNATTTMGKLRGAIDTLEHYKRTLGTVDAYLERFKDTAEYRSSPCYSVKGCSAEEWNAMKATEILGSQAQKKANDAMFRGLDQQQQNLELDASQLGRLQTAARGADGQLQAIGYANQLASQQANQLLQIRALLIAQQNAVATRNQVLQDREAREAAAAQAIRRGTFTPTPHTRTY